MSSLFKKKNKASSKCVWKHKFVCLAFHDQSRIPTTDCEKDTLLEAGLGEKEIEFDDLNIDAEEFRDLLISHYPRLSEGGGFQFHKCSPNSRKLEQLSSTTLSSPAMLKSRVGNARTYIRPMQRDLDITAVFDLPTGVSGYNCDPKGGIPDCIMHSLHMAQISNVKFSYMQPKEKCLQCGKMFSVGKLAVHLISCLKRYLLAVLLVARHYNLLFAAMMML